MVEPAKPTDPKTPGYHAQYTVSKEFKQFWEHLFHQPLSNDDLQKMTDQFVKSVWDNMNRVLKHALDAMKKLEEERKKEEAGG